MQPSPVGSIPGPDLSATLIELANIVQIIGDDGSQPVEPAGSFPQIDKS